MSVQIVKKHDQARGAFDFGRIQENKPIGFPHEAGALRSMSNLFYWAHAWSDTGGLIDTHPHQGFEIMSYVVDGSITHYDTKNEEWIGLNRGDAQLIKSGKGISHAEKFLPGGNIFQIWFDPNLNESMKEEASYADVKDKDFPVIQREGWTEKIIVGEGSPLNLSAEKVEIKELNIKDGAINYQTEEGFKYAIYLISGGGDLTGESVDPDDLMLVNGGTDFHFNASEASRLFSIKMVKETSYTTYAQMQGA